MTHELAKATHVHLPVKGIELLEEPCTFFCLKNRTLIPKLQPCFGKMEGGDFLTPAMVKGHWEVPSTATIHQAQVTEQSSESVRPVSSGLPHLGSRDPRRS